MPCCRAASISGTNRARLSLIEQLILRCEKASDAAANTATSLTPAATASSNPRRLGASAPYTTPGLRWMRAKTSAEPAICGTHLGETKLPASMYPSPASVKASTNCTLSATLIGRASFCRPSRGPTSIRRTWVGNVMGSPV